MHARTQVRLAALAPPHGRSSRRVAPRRGPPCRRCHARHAGAPAALRHGCALAARVRTGGARGADAAGLAGAGCLGRVWEGAACCGREARCRSRQAGTGVAAGLGGALPALPVCLPTACTAPCLRAPRAAQAQLTGRCWHGLALWWRAGRHHRHDAARRALQGLRLCVQRGRMAAREAKLHCRDRSMRRCLRTWWAAAEAQVRVRARARAHLCTRVFLCTRERALPCVHWPWCSWCRLCPPRAPPPPAPHCSLASA